MAICSIARCLRDVIAPFFDTRLGLDSLIPLPSGVRRGRGRSVEALSDGLVLIRVLTDAREHRIALRHGPTVSAKTTLCSTRLQCTNCSRRRLHETTLFTDICCGTGMRSSGSTGERKARLRLRLRGFASVITNKLKLHLPWIS